MSLIQDLKLRRANRYDSAFEKLSLCDDNVKNYKDKEAQEFIGRAINCLKNVTCKSFTSTDKSTEYCKYIQIDKEDKESFLEKIIDDIRYSQEICIEYALKETKKEIMDSYISNTLELVNKKQVQKYLDAVKTLVQLDKIRKINEMEEVLNEIRKDLSSCIDYNDKIQKAENEK